jgi:hypothetical protein
MATETTQTDIPEEERQWTREEGSMVSIRPIKARLRRKRTDVFERPESPRKMEIGTRQMYVEIGQAAGREERITEENRP